MFECDVRLACAGPFPGGDRYVAGDLLMNFAGADERFPADVGVCVECLRAEWRGGGGGLHRAVWRLLNRAAGTDLPFPGIPRRAEEA